MDLLADFRSGVPCGIQVWILGVDFGGGSHGGFLGGFQGGIFVVLIPLFSGRSK